MNSDTINELVGKLIREHTGGKNFFDALDESIRSTTDYFNIIWQKIVEYSKQHPERKFQIVATGQFGVAFKQHIVDYYFVQASRITVFPGGLQYVSENYDDLFNIIDTMPIDSNNCIFVDDSFFSGNTMISISVALRSKYKNICKCFVVYDGSKKKHPQVESLFRYYIDEE